MEANFEKEKNLKALGITAGICALLAVLLFLISWTIPVPTPPPADEGIEVNLGNSDQGSGDIAPAIPGEASAEQTTTADPPPSAPAEAAAESQPVAENNDAEAVAVKTPEKPSEKPKPVQNETSVSHKNKPVAVNPTPVPPKPKAVYAGGSNKANGGNNADSYNGVRNQGIAGGKGDQGKPNGNPNSDSYTGNGGSGSGGNGVSIRSGLQGRRFTSLPSFEDDFNENAKVAVDLTVDASGNVLNATINPRGTTTTNTNTRNIALRKARQLKLNAGSEQQTGTILFSFKLRD